jgi:cyclic di-GMP phosphodiesterase
VTARQDAGTVLVVDDEESIRTLLGALVKRAGGAPVPADSAAQARERAAGELIDLAIVDKNLPDGSGLELLRWLRETSPATHVIIVTGYATVDSAVEALRLGATDYIVKPFDAAAVVRRVELALEQRRLAKALALKEAELVRVQLECVDALGRAAELREPHAAGHARRTSLCVGVLARALDGTPVWIEQVTHAALLHDIGNVGVPSDLLTKPGPLTPEERERVRAHVGLGAEILRGATSDILKLGREVILTHHEWWDGGGYPAGLRGEEIPLAGRVVGLLDAWDAMLSPRPWRPALPFEQVVAELRSGAGRQFDPNVVEALMDCLPLLRAARD